MPKLTWKYIIGIFFILDLSIIYISQVRPDHLTHIYFLDVGQGDSIFIKTSSNQKILIDGGPSAGVVELLDSLMPVWDRDLDLVVLTHPHADHSTGLLEVVKRYPVREFLFNGVAYDSETYVTLLNLINSKHLNVQIADASDSYSFGSVKLNIIYPLTKNQSFTDINDSSIVSCLEYDTFQSLLIGDISTSVEDDLVRQELISDIDILKVAHQGSRTSTGQNLLEATHPEVGIISVGSNEFGHPHKEVTDRLAQSGVQLYRTDLNGTIEVVTDGIKYTVKTQTASPAQ